MERDKLDFGNGRISKLFRALFFPTLIGMFFNSVLNICDGMFVGHGIGSDAIAAVNIVVPLFMICTGIGLMFGSGASVIGSIRLAEGNEKAARIIMTQAYVVGAVIFGCVILVSLLFTHDVLFMFGCSHALEPMASDYLLWLLPGLFFYYLQCVGMMLIRLDGSPRYAMSVQIVSAALNIVLDWLLIYPLDMGVKGASIATSAACIAAGIMVVVYFMFFSDKLKFYRLKLSMKSLKLSLRNVGYMAKIGISTFISEIALGITLVTGNYMFMDQLSETGVAAFSVGCYLFPILFNVSYAVAAASQPIISYNYGAKKLSRVRRTLKVAITTSIICGFAITLLMWQCAPLLAGIFLSPDSQAFPIAASGLPMLGTCTVFFAINITFIGYYQSIEKASKAIIYTLLRGIIFVIPIFIYLPRIIGVDGLWFAIPVAELLSSAIIVSVYFANSRTASGISYN